MKRFVELDILRGFLLLLMVVNHAPTYLRVFTDQPIGFFSTAEGFVFVSAFLAGMLFQRRSEKQGFEAARAATVSRALRIYREDFSRRRKGSFLFLHFLLACCFNGDPRSRASRPPGPQPSLARCVSTV